MEHSGMTGVQICRSKRKFRTKNQAWDFALFQFTTFGDYCSPYTCKHCYQYHVTQKRATEPALYFTRRFNKWYGTKIL